MSRCRNAAWREIRRARRARRRWLKFWCRFAHKPWLTYLTMARLYGPLVMTGEVGRIEGIRWVQVHCTPKFAGVVHETLEL